MYKNSENESANMQLSKSIQIHEPELKIGNVPANETQLNATQSTFNEVEVIEYKLSIAEVQALE